MQDDRVPPGLPRPGSPQTNTESGNALFTDSTISQDDTVGGMTKKRDLLSKFTSRAGNDPKSASPDQQPVPTRPMPADAVKGRPPGGWIPSSSDDEPDVSDGELEDIWPPSKIKADEKARWRRKALAKRATLDRTATVGRENPNRDSCTQDTERQMDGPETCNEIIVSASAANDQSGTNEVSLTSGGFPECSNLSSKQSIPFPAHRVGQQHDRASDEIQPTMSESLNEITEKFLKIDLLDRKQDLSRFIAYLLDTIELLAIKVDFLKAKDADSSTEGPIGKDQPLQSPGRHTNVFVWKVLHRVICTIRSHQHSVSYYEDKPTYRGQHSNGDTVLVGDKIVHSLGDYLDLQQNVCFVVVNEHYCGNDTKHENHKGGQKRSRNFGPSAERLRISAPLLQEALFQVAQYDPFPTVSDSKFPQSDEMRAPYPFLFHHHKELVELASNEMYEGVLTPLLEFLTRNYGKEYEEANTLFKQGMVTVDHISKLFKPQQMVISRGESNALEAHILYQCHATLRDKRFLLSGWSWKYEGNDLNRKPWAEAMDDLLDEQMRIADLKVHPADFARVEDIKNLEERGKRFWDMRGQAHVCYTGWDEARRYHYTGERVMIDTTTYQLMHSNSRLPPQPEPHFQEAVHMGLLFPPKIDPWPKSFKNDEELLDKVLMLLPSSVFGFRLRAKKWSSLLVDNFHSIKWNPEAFGRLVLDDAAKNMIYALINVQKSAGTMDDIIAGKGNGLIILLHGSPGTGKTLTAESVAEIAQKPLYRVTCGDIGTDPKDVENYLEAVLYLGKTWDCVLLLDEADVFLEERTMADLQRNSLVSSEDLLKNVLSTVKLKDRVILVFLRTLEYYDGILILTSNRVGTFDEAFKSRIQVAIHYDNLTKKSRKAIWRNFFDMIEESDDEDANMAELERRLDELAALEMNGRQIRNVLLTARQLAKHAGERLDWKHLSLAIKTAVDFNKYLKTVKGHSDDQWAREEMLR